MQWALKNTICTDICALKETVDISLMSSFLKERHTYKMSEKQNEIRRSKTAENNNKNNDKNARMKSDQQ